MAGLQNRLLAGLGLSVLAGVALAAPHFTATVQATSGTMNLPGPTDYRSDAGAAPLTFWATSAQNESSGPGGMVFAEGTSSAFASALPGGLRLAATAGAKVEGAGSSIMNAQGGSGANASLDDAFTIVANQCGNPALCGIGAMASLSFSVVAHGSVGGGGGPAYGVGGQWTADFSLTTGAPAGAPLPTNVAWHGDHSISDSSGMPPVETQHDSFGVKNFVVSFAFGTPINLHMAASATAQAGASFILGPSSAGFITDMSNTFGWGGISGVTDAAGNAIDYSALSAGSGFDYAQAFAAVPEPASIALMAGGLLLLLGHRRLGRRQ